MSDSPTHKRENNAEPARAPEGALRGLGEAATGRLRGPAPAPSWNPPDCGDIDMRIAADGTWFYCGSPIGRAPLVQLFASIMRKEGDRYVLVTPVEKVGIRVDDAPFLAVEMRVERRGGRAATDVPHQCRRRRDASTPNIRFGSSAAPRRASSPMCGCGAIFGRWSSGRCSTTLSPSARTERVGNEDWFGVRSRGLFFPMCPASEIEGL